MPPSRTAVLNLRIDPGLKEALRIAAVRDHRSISNMIEWLVREHCKQAGITIPEQGSLSLEDKNGREEP